MDGHLGGSGTSSHKPETVSDFLRTVREQDAKVHVTLEPHMQACLALLSGPLWFGGLFIRCQGIALKGLTDKCYPLHGATDKLSGMVAKAKQKQVCRFGHRPACLAPCSPLRRSRSR